tara:strand:- start:97 stop:288 length:192 start_codon:yes stop_codon:yes gene_type:complete
VIKLKELLIEEEDNLITKFNVKVSIDGELEGNEEDVLKFKKYLEEKIQDCLEKYNIQSDWRLD